ncbi:MAG: hypothetical protein OEY56_07710 [Cyclobacteriaceae bacterium]|nr:hypothetical protein [Cyclobacteriaceae bacterium]
MIKSLSFLPKVIINYWYPGKDFSIERFTIKSPFTFPEGTILVSPFREGVVLEIGEKSFPMLFKQGFFLLSKFSRTSVIINNKLLAAASFAKRYLWLSKFHSFILVRPQVAPPLYPSMEDLR